MSTPSGRSERTEPAAGAGAGAGAALAAAPLHPRSFKLRFASQCELGRSHVSAVRPLALPPTVTEAPQRRGWREPAGGARPEPGPEREPEPLLRRVHDAFRLGPRDKYPAPLTTSHQYGWWAAGAGAGAGACGPRHHIRDSAWLKERVRVLAADAGYKR